MNNKLLIQMIKDGWNLFEIRILVQESKEFEKQLVKKRKNNDK